MDQHKEENLTEDTEIPMERPKGGNLEKILEVHLQQKFTDQMFEDVLGDT